ncbi:MAG TPA: tetratricopeptide repeat protein [Actinomycetota bacterium]|nr:tetratricopeptide repeat protein [Actinomycetota bacterium]
MPCRSFVPDYAARLLSAPAGSPPYVEQGQGIVLFADIVGFSRLAAALAGAGRHGAEELSTLLNRFFARMVELVGGHGGTVASFAGDAMTALFPLPGPARARAAATRRAVGCALRLQAASQEFRDVPTAAGTFTLAMRAGLGAGEVLLAVVGDPAIRLEHILAGAALDRAVAAERGAAQGQVKLDPALELGDPATDLPGRPARRRRPPVQVADERLAAFLHPAIAERLHQGQVGLVDERRTVTVVFVDVSGPAGDPPAELERLQRIVAGAVRVIDRWGGHLRQVDVGDKGSLLVVAFGAPVRHEHQEERALRCCMELLALPGGPFRAGVTTGRAWCGEVGSAARREYSLVGDTVNLAARLMEAAPQGRTLVDRSTWEGAGGTAVALQLDPLTVKGRDGPVDVWAVLDMEEGAEPPDRPRPAGSLVGRAAELATARAAVAEVAAGRAMVLTVVGEPGIGKSRLAAETLDHARRLGFTTAAGASRPLGPETSYLPWRAIWRELLGLDPWSSLAEQRDVLAGRFGDHAPLLGPVLNLPVPDNQLTGPLDPAARAELLRSVLAGELRERARSAPLALLVEDGHWIDPSSRALLEHLARGLPGEPLLLMVTTRPTDSGRQVTEALADLPHHHQVTLGELAAADAAELAAERARQLFGDREAPAPGVLGRVVERAGGNPLYLEELLSLVRDRGPGDDPDLPDSVERVVLARLDQLSEADKAVVKVASVLGSRFRAEWISGCYPAAGSPEEVAGRLRRLEELRLTPLLRGDPAPEYGFRHAITQEVTYNSLTLRMRTRLHERVWAYIEETFPHRLAQFADTLAYHYGRTRRVDKQRVWYRAAADAARDAFANETAIASYQRLLPLLEGPASGHVLVELGAVWQLVGRWGDAQQAYLKALGIARAGGDRSLLAAGGRELGDLFIYTKSYAEAVRWLTLATETFEDLGDRRGLSRALDRLAYALIQQGAYPRAAEVSRRHLLLATEAGDQAAMSVALDHLGLVSAYTGDTAKALDLLRRSLAVATAAGDRRGVVHAANNLGGLYASRGEHLEALECASTALRVATEIGYRQMAGVATGNLGELYRERGDHERATACFADALRIAVELGDWTSVANRVASLAATAADLGDPEEAEQRYTLAIRLARTLEAPHFLCEWLHGLAQLQASAGRAGEAERHNQEALAIAGRHAEREVELRARLLRLRLPVERGHRPGPAAAREALALEPEWSGEGGQPARAAVLDAAAQLDPTLTHARATAATLYRELYDRGPNPRYRQAHERLTGTTLPPAPPLPPVPGAALEARPDVGALLRRIEPPLLSR